MAGPSSKTKNGIFMVGSIIAVALMLTVPLIPIIQSVDLEAPGTVDAAQLFSVSYDKNSPDATGSVPVTESHEAGSTVTVSFAMVPSNPTYAFIGWELFQGSTSLGMFYPDDSRNDPSTGASAAARTFTMPEGDVVLKGVWSTDSDTMVITSSGNVVIDYQTGNYVVTSGGSTVTGTEGINNFIIRSGTSTWSQGISVQNTAPKDSASRLRIVLDATTTYGLNISTGSSSPSALAVLNQSYLNLQFAGNPSFSVSNLTAAVINVASAAEVLIIGENNIDSGNGSEYSLALTKPNAGGSVVTASGIGGNALENAGIVRMESGAVGITISNTVRNYTSGIGGGGITTSSESATGGSISYVEINGGTLTISNTGAYITGAGIGGGGSRYGIAGDSGYVVINGGVQNITMTCTQLVYGAGIGGGGAATSSGSYRGGNLQGFIHSQGDLTLNMSGSIVYSAGIGGGGVDQGTAGSVGPVGISGGSVSISMAGTTDTSVYGAGIGGGGSENSNSTAGSGGTVSIKDSTVSISLTGAGDINGAGIGGGGSLSGTPGSNVSTVIESSSVTIIQTSTGDAVNGAGIGGGGLTFTTKTAGSGGIITIKSGKVTINQAAGGYGLNASGIGGGGGYEGSPGSGGTTSIEGGEISISKSGSTHRGTGIGGGGRNGSDLKGASGAIVISGGAVDISFGSGTTSTVAIGGGTVSNVTISGGTITTMGVTSSPQDIGTYSSGTSILVINGGSVKTTNNGTLTGAVNGNGETLYKVAADLGTGSGVTLTAERELYSVLVKTDSVNGGRYRDFNVPYKHVNSIGSVSYDSNIYLYLPSSAVQQQISAEVTSDGQVKWYQALVSGSPVTASIQDGTNVYYRVLYEGTGLRFRDDTVHVVINGTFTEILEPLQAGNTGAPYSISMTVAGTPVPSGDYTYINFLDASQPSEAGSISGPAVTGKLIVTADAELICQITYLDSMNASNSHTAYAYADREMTLAAADLFAPPANYYFSGWRYSGGLLAAGAPFTPSTDIAFYAEWAQYTITYNVNGATSGSDSTQMGYGMQTLSNGSTLVKANYYLSGWNTQPDGNGQGYGLGGSYYLTANAILYAEWSQYTITYNANNATTGSNFTQLGYGSTVLNNGSSLAKTNYYLAGWNTSASGNGTHYDLDQTINLTANTTLYAEWKQYKVTYNNNTGSGSIGSQSGVGLNLSSGAGFTKPGYTLTGWNTLASGAGTPYSLGQAVTLSGDLTLYAIWNANPVTVTYHGNGGTGTPSNASGVTDGAWTLPSTSDYTRPGYTLAGWATVSGGSVVYAPGATTTFVHTITNVYAVWTAESMTVTFNGNGGSGSPASSIGRTGEHWTLPSATDYTRLGYRLVGWSISPSAVTADYMEGSTHAFTYGVNNVYAVWTIDTSIVYNVTVNAGTNGSASADNNAPNGGDNVMITITPDSGYLINTITDNGTDIYGSLNDLGNGSWKYNISSIMADHIINVTFKVDTAATHTISGTITPNAGSADGFEVTLNGQSVTTISDGVFSFTVPGGFSGTILVSKEGYAGASYVVGTVTSDQNNIVIDMSILSYAVIFHGNGADPASGPWPKSYTVDHGYALSSMPSDPTKAGSVFAGWFTFDGVAFDPLTPITENTDLYAYWYPLHTVTVIITGTGSGTVEADIGNGWFEYTGQFTVMGGTVVKVRATPDSGYVFNEWTGYVVSSESEIAFTVDGDASLSAEFREADTPEPPVTGGDEPFYKSWMFWMLMLSALFAVAIYLYYRSGRNGGDTV